MEFNRSDIGFLFSVFFCVFWAIQNRYPSENHENQPKTTEIDRNRSEINTNGPRSHPKQYPQTIQNQHFHHFLSMTQKPYIPPHPIHGFYRRVKGRIRGKLAWIDWGMVRGSKTNDLDWCSYQNGYKTTPNTEPSKTIQNHQKTLKIIKMNPFIVSR